MARYTGKDGAASLGGVARVLDGWEYEENSTSLEATAAGDDWTERTHLRKDYRAQVRYFLEADTFGGIPTTGSSAAFVLSMTGGVGQISGTGLVEGTRVETPHDGLVRLETTIVGASATTGPTIT